MEVQATKRQRVASGEQIATGASDQSRIKQRKQRNPKSHEREMKRACAQEKPFMKFDQVKKLLKQVASTVSTGFTSAAADAPSSSSAASAAAGDSVNFRKKAIKAFVAAADDYITRICEYANLCTIHAGRVTCMPKDLRLVSRILGYEESDGTATGLVKEMQMSKGAYRQLARRGGIRRCSSEFLAGAEGLNLVLVRFLLKIVRDAMVFMRNANRKTMLVIDVVYSLKRNGSTLYGFGPCS